ncbi:Amino terminal of the G-protein receptor rhodopsin [Sorochytrium milnesiophthora]
MSRQPAYSLSLMNDPFTLTQTLALAAFLALLVASCIVNTFLSYVLLKNRLSTQENINLMLTTWLNMGNALTSSLLAVLQSIKLYSGRYALGYWGCQVEGALTTAGIACAMSTVIIITIERYLLIVRERRYSVRAWQRSIGVAYAVNFCLAALPLVRPDAPYVLQPSGIYCLEDLNNTPDVSMPTIVLHLSMFVVVQCLVTGAYGSIYCSVRRAVRTAKQPFITPQASRDLLPPASKTPLNLSGRLLRLNTLRTHHVPPSRAALAAVPDATQTFQGADDKSDTSQLESVPPSVTGDSLAKAEHQAFLVSGGIAAVFSVQLAPYLCNLVLLLNGIKTTPWLDTLVGFCGTSNLGVDAVIVYALNPRVQRMVKDELAVIRANIVGRLMWGA